MTDLSAIESIFLAALEQPTPEARASYLDAACPDPEVRRHVERLLAAHPQVGSFLNASADGTHRRPRVDPNAPGTLIGPYKLMEQIGEGGMGLVFVAEQQQPVRRKVALKIIKPGMDSRDVIARFEAERQALALMDHPNIARVLDAGTTESGRPYFVMELVKGIPIIEYCDGQQLTTRERLELFVTVCQAVQHAHAQGDHPPRPEAVEHPGGPARRRARGQGDRLRRGQGGRPAAHRQDDLHPLPADDRHAALHEPRTGRDQRASTWISAATSTAWACSCTSC